MFIHAYELIVHSIRLSVGLLVCLFMYMKLLFRTRGGCQNSQVPTGFDARRERVAWPVAIETALSMLSTPCLDFWLEG